MRLLPILAIGLGVCRVQAKAVFAHFMVGNVPTWDVATWQADIRVAQAAHIDAFALNIAYGDANNSASISKAFQAANNVGFKLFFSFDYPGGTIPWPAFDVKSYIQQYSTNGAYYMYNGKPFVSTFEGPDNAADWAGIKSATNCFFMPDWSSKGAKVAMTLGNADGLFSWAAWPYGQGDMLTVIDASYHNFLGGKPYMMPVSPWFYTNLPGFGKNWMWKGDNLWFDRWTQVQALQPEFVEIISWNDYGESHYIGPLHDDAYNAFNIGKAPFNYAKGMPHDGWRVFLPYMITTYKNNISSIAQEALSVWYRVNPTTSGCNFGGTTGNTLSQQQCELSPADLVKDRVHYTALLSSPDSVVTVTIGGVASTGTWRNIPDGGIGLYQGTAFFNGRTGAVVVSVKSPAGVTTVNGPAITNSCPNGNFQNWNAWTGSAIGPTNPATPPRRTEEQQCIAGTGVGNLAGLCSYTCQYAYCPPSACTCTQLGILTATVPKSLGKPGYPIATMDHTYDGLCDFACDHGYCPSTACSYVKVTLGPDITQSPFPTCYAQGCTAGHGADNFAGLCSMACSYGHCPKPCTCDTTGNLVNPPATNGLTGCPVNGLPSYDDYVDLCAWTCSHGYCPAGACAQKLSGTVCKNDGYWFGGTGSTYAGGVFLEHSATYVQGSNGTSTTTRDWCENIQGNYNLPSTGQSATDMSWMSKSCSMPEIVNTGFQYTAAQRWAAAGGYDALYQAWLCWNDGIIQYPGLHSQSWSRVAFNYFHGTDNNECAKLDNGCQDSQLCTESGHPAGFLIMNSFVNLHRIATLLKSQIDSVWDQQLITQLGACISTFSPNVQPDDLKWLKILLDVVGLGFAVAAAPVWNIALKTSPRFAGSANQNKLGWIKDTTNSVVSGGITMIKDGISPSKTVEGATQQLSFMAGQLREAWQNATSQSLQTLFDPSSQNFGTFLDLVDEGAVLDRLADGNDTATAHIKTALWASLIPWSWSLSNEQHHAFIMMPDNIDDLRGCLTWDKLDLYVDSAAQKPAMICIDDYPYYILSVKDGCQGCAYSCHPSNINGQICDPQYFRALPGSKSLLTAPNIWGDLTLDTMARGSVASHYKFGNGYSPDLKDPSTFENFGEDGALATATGFFTFPVCSASEAWANFNKGGMATNPNYPCNP